MTERSEEAKQHPNYLMVFAALAVLTAIEVGIALTGFAAAVQIVILLLLALGKATLVALYYMHLINEGQILRIVAAVPVLLVLIVILIPIFDMVIFG